MSIVSLKFILFVLICLLLYYSFPNYQKYILIFASLFYYYSASKLYILFFLFTLITTWLCPLLMEKREKKVWLALCIVANVAVLAFLKYVSPNVSGLEQLILPLGISFYTFQSIGYCVDVYRGLAEPEHNIINYAEYISFFPQISQGPIGRYNDLSAQFNRKNSFEYDSFVSGLERVLIGYFKKIVIANNIAVVVNTIYGEPERYSGIFFVFATVLYAFQLYADFAGYTDIVLGIAQTFGIKLAENFETPYLSTSVSEFWRRWHISLSSWFRDYLYYPLLRSKPCAAVSKKLRKSGHKKLASRFSTVIALLITWSVIGIWHGAGIKYFLYGLYYGLFISLAVFIPKLSEFGNKPFRVIRTFAIVCFGYVLFRAATFKEAVEIYGKMFSPWVYDGWTGGLFWYTDNAYWISLVFSVVSCILLDIAERKQRLHISISKMKLPIKWIIIWIMFLITIYFALYSQAPRIDSSNFIYFNF